jgi:enoyl-CoA hydratase/carnithine racemase
MAVVTLGVEDDLATLTIDNPPLNLFSDKVMTGLEEQVNAVSTSSARALLLRTQGPHFMAGADVRIFDGTSPAQARAMFSRMLAVVARIEELPIPTVCAIQGLCLAAGLELVLSTDIAVAGESTQFAQVERHIGTTTLLGGIHRLAERAGSARAKQIVFDGDRYTAAQFAAWNIVNHVVPDDEVLTRATELARHYAHGPTRALAAGKSLLRGYLEGGIRAGDRAVLEAGAELFATRDMQTGVRKVLSGGSKDISKNTDFTGS